MPYREFDDLHNPVSTIPVLISHVLNFIDRVKIFVDLGWSRHSRMAAFLKSFSHIKLLYLGTQSRSRSEGAKLILKRHELRLSKTFERRLKYH